MKIVISYLSLLLLRAHHSTASANMQEAALRGAQRALVTCTDNTQCTSIWQYCRYGTCTNCPAGEIQNTGGGCKDCPAGSVRGDAKNGTALSDCVNSTDPTYPCDLWEYARYGYCEQCPAGEVGYINAYKSCTDCPAGSVRGTAKTGTALADCVNSTDPTYPCAKWEYARYGYCEQCTAGEVGYINAYKSCTDCPAGSVRGDAKTGTALADCVNSTDPTYPCAKWEYARYGYCELCSAGEVGYINAYKSCTDCPAGSVRGTRKDGTELADCQGASTVCGPWQYARYGYCEQCSAGEVGYINAYKSCTDCPAGSVRGNSTGTAEDVCVGPCKPWQYARYGYCENCPAGEVGYLADFKSCRDCPGGTVRGTRKDGTEFAICISPSDALYPCAKWEYARYGYCEQCPAGEVGYINAYKSCTDCPAGSVRGTVKTGTELADCVGPTDESYPCGNDEYARYGYCERCTSPKVANTGHTTCV